MQVSCGLELDWKVMQKALEIGGGSRRHGLGDLWVERRT
jgi:hypothetical protein